MDTNTLLAILIVAVLILISLVMWARKGGKVRWWLGKAGAELQSPPQALPHRPEQTQIRAKRVSQKMVGSLQRPQAALNVSFLK